MMERTAPNVLVIGLDPYRVPGPWDPEPVALAIDEAARQFVEQGIEAQNCLLGLDGGDDFEAIVTEALRRRSWDCVVIGGGLRNQDDQLDLFELTVNLVHRHAPNAAIAFNRTLTDIVTAAVRQLR